MYLSAESTALYTCVMREQPWEYLRLFPRICIDRPSVQSRTDHLLSAWAADHEAVFAVSATALGAKHVAQARKEALIGFCLFLSPPKLFQDQGQKATLLRPNFRGGSSSSTPA